ncbi:aldehyde dehydrogenase family protein [Nocardiopsis sp. HNM0947]|uniref:Aldehyde dehydrogenase family protein n=1 Tax=Nocardiopsis coralli TaxID=2772213 RepID=A0ABR9P852_9ACTN|nr:aldehyde dehydrogenase family protein [Nocardiopsis coralli]MBE3000024.1 aldehyde dehydrogenase family protein [Nocardiopsis coralli]
MSDAQAPEPYGGFDTMSIGGRQWTGSSDTEYQDRNPYDDTPLTRIRLADTDDVESAYRAAAAAQKQWAATPAVERSALFLRALEVMDRRRGEIVEWLVHEIGGVRQRAEFEWSLVRAGMIEVINHATRVSGWILPGVTPGKENRVYREPVGVVGAITPWNFPMQLSHRTIAPAIALGNAVVLKPAEDSPVTGGLLLARIYEEAGLPPGVLNVVIGKGSRIGDALVTSRVPSLISFTGSTGVGSHIAAQSPLKNHALELGGNGPLVILDDADLDRAADAAVFGSFYHQGQICMSTNRIVAQARVYDEIVDRVRERAQDLRTGDPAGADTQIGPIINDSQLEHARDLITRAVGDGAELLVSGDPSGPAGRVLPPHVLVGGNHVATAAEEVFGPVATIVRAESEEEALHIANDTEYGLSSAVFTEDVERGVNFARRVHAGMTHVNDTTVNDEPNTAFGGEKDSGVGRFGGVWAIEDFTTDHWVSVQHTTRDLPFGVDE